MQLIISKIQKLWHFSFLLLKISIFIFTLFYITYTLFNSEDINIHTISLLYEKCLYSYWFWIALALSPLNWLMEAMKWQWLTAKMNPIPLIQAYKGILSGISIGFVTPHGWGDYLGRILYINSSLRFKAIGAIFISRIFQFLVTLIFALIGLTIILPHNIKGLYHFIPAILLITLSGIVLVFLSVRYSSLKNFIKTIPFSKKIIPCFRIIKSYSYYDYLRVLSLSIIRYIFFTCQYLILFFALGTGTSWLLITGAISLVFFMKSVLPSFNAISSAGIRESAALFFFGLLNIPTSVIIGSGLFIWMINILLPSLIGSFFILKARIIKNQ